MKALFAALVIVALVIALLVIASWPPKIEASREGLHVRHALFGRFIPAAQLHAEAALVVGFAQRPDLRPRWRTMGLGLPGYQAGWFRLHNGEKALIFLRGRGPAAYIPTNAGFSLLIGLDDPAALLSSVRAIGR